MTARATSYSGLMNQRSDRSVASVGTDLLLQRSLQALYDIAIAVCVLTVPLTMAGIREYGVALFVLCSFVMGIAWAAQQLLAPSSNSPMAAAATIASLSMGLVWLQVQPLSEQLLADLSPFNAKYLTLGGGMLESVEWNQISMTPEATRSGLVLLMAYAVFFLTLIQRLRTQQDIDRLIKLVGISVTVMAVIGIVQVLVGDDRFLWMIDHPTRTASWPAKGTFTNQNHFAHFLALGIGPLVWWWQSLDSTDQQTVSRRRRNSRRSSTKQGHSRDSRYSSRSVSHGFRFLIGSCVAILAVGAACSISRGGIAAFMIATAVAICAAGKSWNKVLRLVIPMIVFLGASLLAFGTEELNQRWNQIAMSDSIDDLSHGRWAIWTAVSHGISEFWPAGSGVGSHADVYPIWMSEQFAVRFSHAESGYLQVLLETGLPGFLLLVSGICLCGSWCLKGWKRGNQQQRRQVTALTAGLVASVLHSVVDFVWYIPACMILTLVIVACLCRSSQLTQPTATSDRPGSTRFATLFACVLLAFVLPAGQLFADTVRRDLASAPHWKSFHYSMLEVAESPNSAQVDTLNERLDDFIGELEQCTAADPFHHDAYTALAPLYLQRFEQRRKASDNQMTLQDIRDTARQANFETTRELHEWLNRAFGEDTQDLYRAVQAARLAIQRRPLRSESYLVLTETAFLAELSQPELEDMIAQAVRLRPHHPGVLYAAGLLADDSGDANSAWQIWRHAADLDSSVAEQIIIRFLDRIPVSELIEKLSPNRNTYGVLYRIYGDEEHTADRKTVAIAFADRYRKTLTTDTIADASEWKTYATMLAAAEFHEEAVTCLRYALKRNAADSSARRLLATMLIHERRFKEARRELSWLRARQPDDQTIADLLDNVEFELARTR